MSLLCLFPWTLGWLLESLAKSFITNEGKASLTVERKSLQSRMTHSRHHRPYMGSNNWVLRCHVCPLVPAIGTHLFKPVFYKVPEL